MNLFGLKNNIINNKSSFFVPFLHVQSKFVLDLLTPLSHTHSNRRLEANHNLHQAEACSKV